MAASVRSYSTRFRLNEDRISERGKWINGAQDGIDWYDVITKDGVAFGAVTKGAYTDPTALLTGSWGKNQVVKAKVFSRNPTEKFYQEVEIRLRSTLTPHRCTGYEVFWRCLKTPKAYAEIVRWNGKVGDWTSLRKLSGAQYGVKDGAIVKATVIGNVITGYVNGVEVISVADNTYSAGNPGMGFNFGVEESNVDFGFSYYEVDSYRPEHRIWGHRPDARRRRLPGGPGLLQRRFGVFGCGAAPGRVPLGVLGAEGIEAVVGRAILPCPSGR